MRNPEPTSRTLAVLPWTAGSCQLAWTITTEEFTRRKTSPTSCATAGHGANRVRASKTQHRLMAYLRRAARLLWSSFRQSRPLSIQPYPAPAHEPWHGVEGGDHGSVSSPNEGQLRGGG